MFESNNGLIFWQSFCWSGIFMFWQTLTNPLVKNGSEGLQVLQLWREKVFKLCVQLRSKDIELRGEKEELLSRVWKCSSFNSTVAFWPKYLNENIKSVVFFVCLFKVRSIEQQLQQEQHQTTVLKHSLDDRIAELDLEKVEKEVSTWAGDVIYVTVSNFDGA